MSGARTSEYRLALWKSCVSLAVVVLGLALIVGSLLGLGAPWAGVALVAIGAAHSAVVLVRYTESRTRVKVAASASVANAPPRPAAQRPPPPQRVL